MSVTELQKRARAAAEPAQQAPPGPPRRAAAWLLGPASGLLLYLAFPPIDRPFLAWVALVPLLALIESSQQRRTIYLSAWLGGVLFWVGSLVWIWELHPAAWLAWISLALYQSAFWPLFVAFTRGLRRRLPLLAAAPIAWVACEFIQAHALSGFPWYYLAHAQFRELPLIQISDVTGAWGVSFLVVLMNVWILGLGRAAPLLANSPKRFFRDQAWPTSIAVALLAITLVYGTVRLDQARRFTTGPRALLLQSNMQQAMKMSLDHDEIIGMYANLIRAAFRGDAAEGVDIIVWPETSYPTGWVSIEASAGAQTLEKSGRQLVSQLGLRDWFDRRIEGRSQLTAWSRELGAPMLVGLPTYELSARGGFKGNGVALIDGGDAEPTIYEKMHLVPFGEYIPFMDIVPAMKRLAPYDDDRVPKLRAGRKPVWFDHGKVRYAAAICFEDTLPHLVRRFFREAPDQRQPDVLVNMSNDGWFNGSAEHDMHLASGVFRCVENRVPLLRSANMGYTAVVDGNGAILRVLPKKTEGTLTRQVPLDPRTSVYSQFGDWLPLLCLLACLVSIVANLVRRRRSASG